MVALKNNMIYDLVLVWNVEVEFSIGKRWSLNTEYKMSLVVEQSETVLLSASFRGGVEVRHWWAAEICVGLENYPGVYTEGEHMI